MEEDEAVHLEQLEAQLLRQAMDASLAPRSLQAEQPPLDPAEVAKWKGAIAAAKLPLYRSWGEHCALCCATHTFKRFVTLPCCPGVALHLDCLARTWAGTPALHWCCPHCRREV